MTAIKPYDAGRYAWGYGDTLADNPHPPGSSMYQEWERGYKDELTEQDDRLSQDLGAAPDPLRGRMRYLIRTLDGLQIQHQRAKNRATYPDFQPMPGLTQ